MGLTPARRRGVEILDDRATSDHVRRAAMQDVVRANTLFGGTRSALGPLRSILPTLPRKAVLLDVGTGLADIPANARRAAADAGVELDVIGVDISEGLLQSARRHLSGAVAGHALSLPFCDGAADVVICSQLLHHFRDGDVGALLAEVHRVSRAWVVISDLRRSWLAAGGFWLASSALRFHSATRHDGVASVLRGFTAGELAEHVERATGVRPHVRRGAFWRLSATWRAGSG
jgi:SAM-dependent methyltransferase